MFANVEFREQGRHNAWQPLNTSAFPKLREIGMQADKRETGIDVQGKFNNEPMLLRWQTGNAIQAVQQWI